MRRQYYLLLSILCLYPPPSSSFTLPSRDSPSRNSGGEQNFRNDADEGADISVDQILKNDRSRRQTNTDEYRRQRYNGKNNGPPKKKRKNGVQRLNENSTLSLKLSELSEVANKGNGERAETILISLESEGNAPRTAYLATIRAWLSRDRVTQALNVIARMEASRFRVTAADYRPILKAFTKIGQPNEAIRLLNHMSKCKTGRPILKDYDFEDPKRRKSIWTFLSCSSLPDARCLTIVCNEYVKKKLPDRVKVTRGMYEWAKRYKRDDNYLFNIALSSHDDTRDMEKFLLLHADANTHAICYMTVISAYFKQRHVYKRGKKMESLLRRLEQAKAGGAIRPDLVTYRQVMQAYMGDNDPTGAVAFLEKAFGDVKSGRVQDTSYSTDLFLSWGKRVIDMVAKHDDFEMLEAAKMILDTVDLLEDFVETKGESVDIEFYHFVMDNFIRAKRAFAIPFVEYMYKRIQDGYRTKRKEELKPNAKTLNIVLKAYSKSRDTDTMEKAEAILLRMEETYRNANNTDQCVAPDVVSYSTVIQGWASCRSPDSIQRADMVAKRLNEMYKSGNEAAKPDQGVDLACLNAQVWHRRRKGNRALSTSLMSEDRLDSLINRTPPDLVALTKLIKDRRSSDAGEKAEAIIDRLLERYEDTRNEEMLPDAVMFTSAMSAWGRCQLPNAASKAERILDKMLLLYDLTRVETLKPNALHFIAVIRAYSQPNQPKKAQNAKRVFDRMMTMHDDGFLQGAPSRDAFIAVLKACSHARGIAYQKSEELKVVQELYVILCGNKHCSHNEASYGAYMGAVRNCMERGSVRTSVLKKSFERCCNDGFVDGFILGQLRRSLTPTEFKEFVGSDLAQKRTPELADLPTYWTRNIEMKEGKQRRLGYR